MGEHLFRYGGLLDNGAIGRQVAVQDGDAAIVASALEANADPNAPDSEGNALLALAAMHGQMESARLLLLK